MTVIETLQSLTGYDDENLLSKALIDNNLNADEEYSVEKHQKSLYLAAADVYDTIAIMPEIKEGDMSIKYNVESLKAMAKVLRKHYGSTRPKITGKKIW